MVDSSAYKSILKSSQISDMSFMYSKNSSGPKIDPCGTPDIILRLSYFMHPILTTWVRLDRYDLNNFIAFAEK